MCIIRTVFEKQGKAAEEKMYDCIVVGAGIAGAVAARIIAEEKGKRVLVLERRAHIGGNCYDEREIGRASCRERV